MDPHVIMLALIEGAEQGPEALQAVKDYLAAHPEEFAADNSAE